MKSTKEDKSNNFAHQTMDTIVKKSQIKREYITETNHF